MWLNLLAQCAPWLARVLKQHGCQHQCLKCVDHIMDYLNSPFSSTPLLGKQNTNQSSTLLCWSSNTIVITVITFAEDISIHSLHTKKSLHFGVNSCNWCVRSIQNLFSVLTKRSAATLEEELGSKNALIFASLMTPIFFPPIPLFSSIWIKGVHTADFNYCKPWRTCLVWMSDYSHSHLAAASSVCCCQDS